MSQISAGSFSRISVFQECRQRAKYEYVDRVPKPDRGDPPAGKAEWPDLRGIRVHDECNMYIIGQHPDIPVEASKHFEPEMKRLRELFSGGIVVAEETWGFDRAWNVVPWNDWQNCAFRVKTDSSIFPSEKTSIVIDYKTGKKFGNEVKHAEQMEVYALGTFLKYPKIEEVIVELWYFDTNDLSTFELKRKDMKRLLLKWDSTNSEMLNTTDFPPNPNIHTCRFCPYSPRGSGYCKVGV